MYFFRVEISSFDDERKTLFIVPEQTEDDFSSVPFSEKQLTQTAAYKQFVKETKTNVVDVSYELFNTPETVTAEITEEQFEQIRADGKLERIDGNELSIVSGSKSGKGGKGGNLKMYALIGAVAVVVIILIAVSATKGKGGDETSGTGETTAEVTVEATAETTQGTSETSTAETPGNPTHEITTPATLETKDVYVDVPYTEQAAATTEETSTPNTQQTSSGSSSGSSTTYTISFNANGGTGELESIVSEPDQYVVLPTASEAAKSISRQGYKLIGFTDNRDVEYPLYDYKMPYQNITLFAVWETEEYKVTYNSNGGTGQLSVAAVKYGEDIPLPTDIAVYKEGYELAGWSTDKNAKSPVKSMKMPYENTTLYAVWSTKKQTAKLTMHYDDSVMVRSVEIGSVIDMEQDFGITKDGYIISGWYFENSPGRIEYLDVEQDTEVYAKWQPAEYITITVDRSYLNQKPERYKVSLDMNGYATFKMPKVNDRSNVYDHVYGCTYGFSRKKQTGEYGSIEYYSDTEYQFSKDTTLYRVLNMYGGGKGTVNDPYIIDYYDQLLLLAENKAKGYFIQTKDIKFPGEIDRQPIGTVRIGKGYESKYYDLFVYDGQGYKITGLYGDGGLFGTVAASTIKNIVIDGATISVAGTSTSDYGILCNRVTSYAYNSAEGSEKYGTGNTRFENCKVSNSKLYSDKTAQYIGGLVGSGGELNKCYAYNVLLSCRGNTSGVGGIVGNACFVKGSLANVITIEGSNITAAGGIAGSAFGTQCWKNGSKAEITGGSIFGCGVRGFSSSGAQYCGGITGQTTSNATGAYIKSCYVANIILNGSSNGSISGGDNLNNGYAHSIAFCIIDKTNGYPSVGGKLVNSHEKTRVLTVPADGLTVDGVLSVLNASGSGYTEWQRSKDKNSGYPFPGGITF